MGTNEYDFNYFKLKMNNIRAKRTVCPILIDSSTTPIKNNKKTKQKRV